MRILKGFANYYMWHNFYLPAIKFCYKETKLMSSRIKIKIKKARNG